MPENNKYKILSIVFAIIAVVFAVLYFTKPEPTISEIYGDITARVEECSAKITEWRTTYGAQASSTEKQAAFDAILEDCKDVLTISEEKF